jgi:hypothetical protein
MPVKKDDDMELGGAESTGNGGTKSSKAKDKDPRGPQTAPGSGQFDQYLHMFAVPSSLSTAANEYVNTVMEKIKGDSTGFAAKINKIEILAHNTPCVFIMNEEARKGVLLAFRESSMISDAEGAPISSQILQSASDQLARDHKYSIISFMLVVPEDYTRATQMAYGIRNHLVQDSLNNKSLNIGMMTNETLIFDTDQARVREFMNTYSPHGIRARDDLGVILYRSMPGEVQQQPWMAGQQNIQRHEKAMLAVTGYVEFEKRQNQPQNMMMPQYGHPQYQYNVILHITDIVCPWPDTSMLAIALGIFTQAFIGQQGWKTPFLNTKKGQPNIGTLFTKDEASGSKLWVAESPSEAKYALDTYFDPNIFLVMDICEGRFTLPAMNALLYDQQSFVDTVNQSLLSNINVAPCTQSGNNSLLEFVGGTKLAMSESDPQGTADTRYIDYLRLTIDGRQNPMASNFLIRKDPVSRAKDMREVAIGTSIRWLYLNHIMVFQQQFIAMVNNALQRVRIMPRVPRAQGFEFQTLGASARISNVQPFAGIPQPAFGNSQFTMANPYGRGF